MSLTSDLLRGHTDSIILAQLIKHDSYGYEINKIIQEASGSTYELKEATLYTAFRRLEGLGLITSYWGDENTGARRRYYAITGLGKATFLHYIEEWTQAKNLIDKLLEEGTKHA